MKELPSSPIQSSPNTAPFSVPSSFSGATLQSILKTTAPEGSPEDDFQDEDAENDEFIASLPPPPTKDLDFNNSGVR